MWLHSNLHPFQLDLVFYILDNISSYSYLLPYFLPGYILLSTVIFFLCLMMWNQRQLRILTENLETAERSSWDWHKTCFSWWTLQTIFAHRHGPCTIDPDGLSFMKWSLQLTVFFFRLSCIQLVLTRMWMNYWYVVNINKNVAELLRSEK